ncbi:hypothetical protein GE061_004277 [Apolygus lucorum]|uniref:Uncharacterized protein n=1 Tax=Apolygus lucorum TaxID=248454 RepID=A0A6A4IQ99_APOLU|nr:hypothetical protein GE061_004277 [Apolygus lucorum]
MVSLRIAVVALVLAFVASISAAPSPTWGHKKHTHYCLSTSRPTRTPTPTLTTTTPTDGTTVGTVFPPDGTVGTKWLIPNLVITSH